MKRFTLASRLCMGAALSVFCLDVAYAAEDGAGAEVQEVVVTGSRISRSTFNTPNPVTVMGTQQIQNLGLSNIGDVLAELPQNSSLYSPAAQANSNFNTGANFANLRGLNPFFGTRTLTLIDTRRVVPTSTGGAVDLNMIPSLLVGRIETVTGGASAAYGSDAVAGVVNVILDTGLNGFRGQIDYGQTSRSDGRDYHIAGAYGRGFANGRAHLVVGGEYEHQEGIGDCARERSWCAGGYIQSVNPLYAVTGGPQYVIGPNGKQTGTTLNGVFYAPVAPGVPVPGAVIGQLNDTATGLGAFNPGLFGGPFSQTPRQGGDGIGIGVYDVAPLLPDIERYSLFAHADYEVTDSTRAFAEGSFAGRESATYQAQTGTSGLGSFITPDNAFLTPAVAAAIGTGGFLYRSGNDLPRQSNKTTDETWRVAGGLKGTLSPGWGWDVYLQYGRHTTDALVRNVQATRYFGYAMDAVRNAAGNIVCRATLLGNPDAAGCQPLNLLGANPGLSNAAQAAGFAYAYRPLVDHVSNNQFVAAANLNGELFGGWGAGPVRGAIGGEYRRDRVSDLHDLATTAPYYYQMFANFGDPYNGETKVVEGFAELNVPVLRDAPLVKALEIDGAIRRTRNKTEGSSDHSLRPGWVGPLITDSSHTVNFTTWKISGVWDVNDWLRFRATRSRDVRAPSFQQLFTQQAYPAGFPAFATLNPNQAVGGVPGPTYFPSSTFQANPNLDPERANTTTAGIILSPTAWASGLRISADWYQIQLKGAIALLPNGATGPLQAVVNNCVTTGTYCNLINGGTFSRTSTAAIVSVNDPFLNLGAYTTRGVDIEVAYSTALDRFGGLPGDLDVRVIGSYVYDMLIDTGAGKVVDYAGQSGPAGGFSGSYNPTPKFQANTFVTYANGPFTGSLQVKYVGSGHYQTFDGINRYATCTTTTCGAGSINNNQVSSAVYVNLSASYKIGSGFELFGRIDNLFDKAPPLAPNGAGTAPTNPALFDTLGTAWRLGARLRY